MLEQIPQPEKKYLGLPTSQWVKIGSGLLVASVGAMLTYLTETIPNIDFGEYAPFVTIFFSVIANIIRKWLAEQSK